MMESAAAETRTSVAGFSGDPAGVTPPRDPGRHGSFLSDVVVELGYASPEVVEHAVEAARHAGSPLGRLLLDTGALDEDQLSRALAERYGLDHVDLNRFEVNMEAALLIPASSAARYRALPIDFATDGALIVAVTDPLDALGLSDIEVITRSEVRPVVADPTAIEAVIETLPSNHQPVSLPDRPPAPTPAEVPPEPEAQPEPEPSPASTSEPEPETMREPERSAAPEPEPKPLRADDTPDAQEGDQLSGELVDVSLDPDSLGRQLAAVPPEAEGAKDEAGHAAQPQVAPDDAETSRDEPASGVGELSAQLKSLQAAAQRAGALAGAAERRLSELEDADRRASEAIKALERLRLESQSELERRRGREEQLERELAQAKERCDLLQRQLSDLVGAAADAKAATEKLGALHRALERSSEAEARTPGLSSRSAPEIR